VLSPHSQRHQREGLDEVPILSARFPYSGKRESMKKKSTPILQLTTRRDRLGTPSSEARQIEGQNTIHDSVLPFQVSLSAFQVPRVRPPSDVPSVVSECRSQERGLQLHILPLLPYDKFEGQAALHSATSFPEVARLAPR
jgi:hypothetical protein